MPSQTSCPPSWRLLQEILGGVSSFCLLPPLRRRSCPIWRRVGCSALLTNASSASGPQFAVCNRRRGTEGGGDGAGGEPDVDNVSDNHALESHCHVLFSPQKPMSLGPSRPRNLAHSRGRHCCHLWRVSYFRLRINIFTFPQPTSSASMRHTHILPV